MQHPSLAVIDGFDAGMGAMFNCMLIALDKITKDHPTAIPVVHWINRHYSCDPSANIWPKYFELVGFQQVELNDSSHIVARYKGDYDDTRMDYRRTLHNLYTKHVRVKNNITDIVDGIFQHVCKTDKVIGVQLRNTDRCIEPQYASPGVHYVAKKLLEEVAKLQSTNKVFVFIASDNSPDAEYIKSVLDPSVTVIEDPNAVRSSNHISVHGTHDNGMRGIPNDSKALSVLTDIFCLARCDVIVRTCSNVSAAAGIININAKIVDVSLQMGKYTETWLSRT